MTHKYWLPDEQGKKTEYETDQNAVIIIGANGAGKSKLGAWIEQQSMGDVHRVGAQRNLNFNEHIQLKSYSEAENWVFYGSADGNNNNKNQRWDWGKYTTKLMDDFDHVLSALIALKNNEISMFNEKGIAAAVGDKLGVDKREYQGKVINLIRGACHDEIVDALSGYLPVEIPR